nr:fibronectin type III domain-containing protein [Microbacterium lemovicicum]
MAYSEGQLNGSADFRVGINIYYSGVQDYGANASRFDWQVVYKDVSGYGSWTGSNSTWNALIGGVGYTGTFTTPASTAGQYERVVASGSTWHNHDSEGFRPGFPSSASVDAPHSAIGSGNSGDAWVDAPRIPKVPAAPAILSSSDITPTSFGITYSRGDNRGAAIEEDQAQWSLRSDFTTVVWNDFKSTFYTNPYRGAGPALTPGTTYYVRVRSRNSQGWGAWSGTGQAKTLSGMYVWNGSAWKSGEVLVWNGTAWKTGLVHTWNGTAWVLAS